MNYVKMGLVFQPAGNYEWMHYYAATVTALDFDTFIRFYFTTRSKIDEFGNFKTYITYMDCDRADPRKIIYIHNKPLLEFGQAGTFDEHGTMIADVKFYDGKYFMYYLGWQRSSNAPYLNRVGLATSDDGINFVKISEGPVMGINRFVPFGYGNLSILIEDGTFHMWYTHYKPWLKTDIGYRPNYDIRYGWSPNGLDWEFGENCINPANDNEAIATPCVRKINGQYHMWYSYRPGIDSQGKSGAYRIGYAVSDNKIDWVRKDSLVDLNVSESGWDSEMVCYPEVLDTKDNLFLFYCGNHYGRDGFGCAKIENL